MTSKVLCTWDWSLGLEGSIDLLLGPAFAGSLPPSFVVVVGDAPDLLQAELLLRVVLARGDVVENSALHLTPVVQEGADIVHRADAELAEVRDHILVDVVVCEEVRHAVLHGGLMWPACVRPAPPRVCGPRPKW